MAAWRSATDRKTPRFNRRLVSLAKNPSTALSHEQEVGVKWNVHRGCAVRCYGFKVLITKGNYGLELS